MLAVAGGKGGCGKTTTTLGLALAAAHRGRSVLVVDADVDVPDLHRVAGIGDSDVDRPGSLERRQADGRPDPEPRSVPGTRGVSVLPARPGTNPGALQERIRGTISEYDMVLVDCPAGAGRDAAIPLRAADETVLVSTDREPSLRDAAKTRAMARAVATPIAGAVLTRTEQVPDGVVPLLGTTTIEAVPPVRSPLRDRAAIRRYGRILRRLPSV